MWSPRLSDLQAEFVASTETEVLFGGRAGVGKTYVAAIDALGLNRRLDAKGDNTLVFGDAEGVIRPAIMEPWYSGVIIRRTEPELHQVVNLTKELYPKVDPGAKYTEDKRLWRFSSGAEIRFGYLKHPSDKYRYQGDAYQFVLFEELTHHPTSDGFLYLKTRTRAPKGEAITIKMRATTNPGGEGEAWVQKRWRINRTGDPTNFSVSVRKFSADGEELGWAHETRRFISARGRDNPFVDPTYVDRLTVGQSSQVQLQLRDGLWGVDNLEGTILQMQIEQAYEEDRIVDLPVLDTPAHTFWDLGTRDTQAFWVIQPGPDGWFHVLDFYQNSMKPAAHYVQMLHEMASRRGYTLGTHYLPHDARQQQQGGEEVRTKEQIFRSVGLKPTKVAKRIARIDVGIELLRSRFSRLRFNARTCEAGLAELKKYRFVEGTDGSIGTTPDHKHSHAADALRTWATGFTESVDLDSQMDAMVREDGARQKMLEDARRRIAAHAKSRRGYLL